MRTRFAFALVIIGSILSLGLSACSNDEPETTTGATAPAESTTRAFISAASRHVRESRDGESPSPVPALCSSVEELQTSAQGLTEADLTEDGADALATGLEDVKNALVDVEQEAEETFSSDIAAVRSSIDDVEAVVQQVQGGASVQDVASEAASALSSLSGSVAGLVATSEDQGCNLSS